MRNLLIGLGLAAVGALAWSGEANAGFGALKAASITPPPCGLNGAPPQTNCIPPSSTGGGGPPSVGREVDEGEIFNLGLSAFQNVLTGGGFGGVFTNLSFFTFDFRGPLNITGNSSGDGSVAIAALAVTPGHNQLAVTFNAGSTVELLIDGVQQTPLDPNNVDIFDLTHLTNGLHQFDLLYDPGNPNGDSPYFLSTLLNGDPIVDAPEPATLALFGIGLAGLGLVRRRKTA